MHAIDAVTAHLLSNINIGCMYEVSITVKKITIIHNRINNLLGILFALGLKNAML
jgi:hypothetical protein